MYISNISALTRASRFYRWRRPTELSMRFANSQRKLEPNTNAMRAITDTWNQDHQSMISIIPPCSCVVGNYWYFLWQMHRWERSSTCFQCDRKRWSPSGRGGAWFQIGGRRTHSWFQAAICDAFNRNAIFFLCYMRAQDRLNLFPFFLFF